MSRSGFAFIGVHSRFILLCGMMTVVLTSVPLRGADKPVVQPRVTAMCPLAVPQGFAGSVRLRGFKMKDATEIRVDGTARPAKIEIKERKDAAVPTGMEKDLLGEGEVIIELTLAADCPAGPLLVTAAQRREGRSVLPA